MLSLIGWWLSQALDKPWQSVLICWSPSSLCQTQLLPDASTEIIFSYNLACVMWGSDWESMFSIIFFFIYQATGCFVETYKNYLRYRICRPFLRFLDPEIEPFQQFLDSEFFFFCPFLQFLDPKTAVFLQFLDPETAPFLQFVGALWIVGWYLPSPCERPYGS